MKKAERKKRFDKMMKKQLKEAYKYPFCRRCKKPLTPEWCVEMKKKKMIPLCKDCVEPMLAQYKKCMELWQKFKQ